VFIGLLDNPSMLDVRVAMDTEGKEEVSSLLEPYLDDQVMNSVFEAKQHGVRDLVIYLDLPNKLIYQLERDSVLEDPGAPSDLKDLISNSSNEANLLGVEVPGYVSFWFVVSLPDSRLAAMACSILQKTRSGFN
jgi:hypothetical protein